MILIYSNQCKHCNILIETINKHDTNNIIKKISVDTLRINGYNIDSMIHSVPALVLLQKDKDEIEQIMYGKQVFDHLLLPNRGVLFTQDNNTRLNKLEKDHLDKKDINNDNNMINIDPMAFTLKTSLSDNFSLIDEEADNLLTDKNYNWDLITNDNNITNMEAVTNDTVLNPVSSVNDKNEKNLPSIEELLSKRQKDIL
tara:strand:+ start:1326 stop:1922 length:597 start_codon:yes stop_codon:yes gene_type:complete